MTIDSAILIVGAVTVFLLGVAIGAWVESWDWRRNADQLHRKESGGRLFKVHHAGP